MVYTASQALRDLTQLDQYLASAKHAGATEDQETFQATLMHITTEMFAKVTSLAAISLPDGTKLMKMVGASALPCKDRHEILRAIQTRITLSTIPGSSLAPSSGEKSFFLLHLFMTQGDWDRPLSAAFSESMLSLMMVQRALKMDLVFVSERTYTHWASILRLRAKSDAHMCPDGGLGKRLVDLLKAQHHASRQGLPRSGLMQPLPTDPADFLQRFPDKFIMAYPGYSKDDPDRAGPIRCPLDVHALEFLFGQSPTRNSHHTIAARMMTPKINSRRHTHLTHVNSHGNPYDTDTDNDNNKQTNTQTRKQTHKQTNTHTHTNKQTDRQTNKQTNK